jgi:mannan endo-1,4-beta-mannosidase
VGSARLSIHHRFSNHYPAVFGQDFGFSYPGYWDGINYRQRMVDEAILCHREGVIITFMWHAVRPIEEEPVEFLRECTLW